MSSIESDSERMVLAQLAKGSAAAFKLIFESYRDRVYTVALRVTRSPDIAEEVVQEIFAKVWAERKRLDDIENFAAYIRTMSRNYTLNLLRHNLVLYFDSQDLTSIADNQTQHATDDLGFREMKARLEEAISILSPQQRAIYRQSQLEGEKLEDVAARLNISVLTAKTHLQRARHSVRTFMNTHAAVTAFFSFLIFHH